MALFNYKRSESFVMIANICEKISRNGQGLQVTVRNYVKRSITQDVVYHSNGLILYFGHLNLHTVFANSRVYIFFCLNNIFVMIHYFEINFTINQKGGRHESFTSRRQFYGLPKNEFWKKIRSRITGCSSVDLKSNFPIRMYTQLHPMKFWHF
jgi:hypothetical protein